MSYQAERLESEPLEKIQRLIVKRFGPTGGWRCIACDACNFTPHGTRCGNPTCPTRKNGQPL
jgi:hypothetical protein